VSSLGPEALRLLALLRALRAGRRVDPSDLPPPASMRHHRLGPLAFCAGAVDYRADYAAAALAAARAAHRVDEAVAALTAAGIPVALIKGISYARSLYTDPAERPMADIDLLVPAARHPAAIAALAAIGYRPGAAARLHHALMLVRGDDVIDLHRAILAPRCCRIDADAVWRRSRPAAERTDGARRLEPVDEALYHFAALGRTALFGPLLAYLDAARLLDRLGPTGRAALGERARAYRVGRLIAAGVALTDALLDRRAPPPWPAPALAELASGREPAPNRRRLRILALCDHPRQAAGWLAQWSLERGERFIRTRTHHGRR
jgi:hypothetical protein